MALPHLNGHPEQQVLCSLQQTLVGGMHLHKVGRVVRRFLNRRYGEKEGESEEC